MNLEQCVSFTTPSCKIKNCQALIRQRSSLPETILAFTWKYHQRREQLAAARPEAPSRIRVASSGVTKGVRARACAAQVSGTESVGGGCRWRGSPRGSGEGWQPAATVSVVTGSEGSGGYGSGDGGGGSTSPGVAFRRRGWKSRETEGCPRRSLVLARTRTPGWPGVLLWIRRSRLDIDKWLAEGEPNTAPLLHMQGHPFVRTWARGKERGRRRWWRWRRRLRQRG